MDSPFISIRRELWTIRSRTASATVASSKLWWRDPTGTCEAIIVDDVPMRSSQRSRSSRDPREGIGANAKSSIIKRSFDRSFAA